MPICSGIEIHRKFLLICTPDFLGPSPDQGVGDPVGRRRGAKVVRDVKPEGKTTCWSKLEVGEAGWEQIVSLRAGCGRPGHGGGGGVAAAG